MVNIKDVKASNLSFQHSPHNHDLVAVFVGATRGIGLGTVKQFVKYANRPTVYFIGSSQISLDALHADLTLLNPTAQYHPICKDVSLIKNVDDVCDLIKAEQVVIDILFMTVSITNFEKRNGTSISSCTKLTVRSRSLEISTLQQALYKWIWLWRVGFPSLAAQSQALNLKYPWFSWKLQNGNDPIL